MQNQSAVVLDELIELCRQYKLEMPGKRKAWPRSIKTRVFELIELGVNAREVAEKSGVAYQTIYAWMVARRKDSQQFHAVAVVEKPVAPARALTARQEAIPTLRVRQKYKPRKKPKDVSLQVVTKSGMRIEGLDLESLMSLMTKLESVV